VEIGVCLDCNLQAKVDEKRSKYVPLDGELCKLKGWKRWKIVAVVVGASGTIPSQLRYELNKLPLTTAEDTSRILQEVQRAVIYSAVRIIRSVVSD